MKKLPMKMKMFFTVIYTLTVISLYYFINTNYIAINITNYKEIVFFSVLVILTESFTTAFRNISFTTTFAVTIAVYILFGPLTTIIITLIGFSLRVLKVENRYKHILNTPFYGTVFNYCVLTLPIIYGNYFYRVLGGNAAINFLTNNVLQVVIFSMVFVLINALIISIMYSLHANKKFSYAFLSNIKLMILSYFSMIPFGIILALIFNEYSYFGVILFICPIILARYTITLYVEAKSQYVGTVDALMRAMEARDKYTEGHSQRVAELVGKIAKQLKYNEWEIEKLNIASLLHDVGKIGVDDHILNKPGKLTEEEFNIIKSHPEIGYGILQNVKNLKDIVDIVRHHHERYDGKGYPQGKNADELSLDVFIVQLADSVDAMATDRPYRKALTQEEIIAELRKHSGTQFHPKVVDAYLGMLEKQNKAV